jgi:hypothetical protein
MTSPKKSGNGTILFYIIITIFFSCSTYGALCSDVCGETTCYNTVQGATGGYIKCSSNEKCIPNGTALACYCNQDATCSATTSTTSGGPTTTVNKTAPEKAIEKRVNEVVCTLFNLVLMTAGAIAALMIMFAGLNYMRAGDDPSKADNAKKMIGYALTGLFLVFIACPVVDILVTNTKIVPFEQSCKCFASGGGGGGTTTTTIGSGTTTTTTGGGGTTTTTTTTTTSTIPLAKRLTAENLAACINSKGIFYTDHNCHYCVLQKNLFYAEVGADVGDGKNVYDSILTIDSNPANSPCGTGGGLIPCWAYPAGGKTESGCKTFPQLRTIYECDLIEVPGHSYYTICS